MRTFVSKLALAAAAVVAMPAAAGAAVNLGTVTPGTAIYSGPAPTIDFDVLPGIVSGGSVASGSTGVRAQPFGSSGNYWAVGPGNGATSAVLDLSSIGDIYNISFLWGSVDSYNFVDFLDEDGLVIATFDGTDIFNPANGNQSDPNTNPVVRFDVTDQHISTLKSIRLRSNSDAFEVDNFAINAVPEPGTWALMVFGFALAGFGMRRRRQVATPRFA